MFGRKLIKIKDWETVTSSLQYAQEDVQRATQFIQKIQDGNLIAEYYAEGENADNQDSILEKSLVSMQTKMKEFAEKERERNWTNEGMAKFVEILRANHQDEELLYQDILSNIVKYLGALQGGLYIINDEDPQDTYIELVSCYAFSRKKYIEKKIAVGEGLVGQCYLEKDTIYMTEVPKEFLQITSGLGDSKPSSILIVPLKINEDIFGILELASFQYFPSYRIQFIEKLGESIASTLANTKITARTKKLLNESQIKEEQLRAQEEEMRQNMEELQTTQEEMERKEKQLQGIVEESKKKEAEILLLAQKHQEEIENLHAEIERLKLQVKRKDKKIEELETITKINSNN